MIEIKVVSGEIKISGTFDFGYMGVYKDDQISIYSNLEEIKTWDIVTSRLDVTSCSDDEIADCLTAYYNEFEKRVQQNRKQVNDNFLLNIMEDMEACGCPFWEIDEITVKEALPSDPDEEVYQPHWDRMTELEKEYDETPNDGTMEKTDIEMTLKLLFPMLNLDKLVENIVPESLGLSDGCVSFQCSDNFGEQILCSAYDDLDEQLTFTDWHNF